MSFFHFFKRVGESLKDLFLLAVRLFWGAFFFKAGLGKFMNPQNVVDFFTSLHIPYPEFMAHLVTWTEMICGALLFFGLFTRVAAIPLIIVMLTALWTADHDAVANLFTDPQEIVKQSPFTFLLASLIAFIFGPGRYSLDHLFCSKCRDHCDKHD